MDEYRFRRRDALQRRQPDPSSGAGIQVLLSAEEQLLQSISARASLPELLNKICSTLDCDIGNMVSLISLRNGGATDLAEVARDAKHFGLYAFCSASVIGENEELLGSLEMYCCVPHRPSFCELQLIERAVCLAAIAIKRYYDVGDDDGNPRIHAEWPVRGYVLQWPVSVN
jgi:hypothetical protein